MPRRRGLIAAGLVLVAAAVLVLGYVAWQLIGTNIVSRHKQEQHRQQITTHWKNGSDGEGIGLLRIPRFGVDYAMPILSGFDQATLAEGVGWHEEGARPGQIGNLVLAAHRVTHGEPFAQFPELAAGDLVEVETRAHLFTYRLTDSGTDITVDFHTLWPLQPVPEPGAEREQPTQARITLLTCSEIFHTDNRSVVRGVLVDTQNKSQRSR